MYIDLLILPLHLSIQSTSQPIRPFTCEHIPYAAHAPHRKEPDSGSCGDLMPQHLPAAAHARPNVRAYVKTSQHIWVMSHD